MADRAHVKTDEKLEEMEKRLSAIYSRAEKTVQKKMADYAKSIDEKSEELLQAYKDAETEEEKRKAKKAYIRFYRKLVKSKEFISLSANVADDLYRANVEASAYINLQTPSIYALNYNWTNAELEKEIDGFIPLTVTEKEATQYGNLTAQEIDKKKDIDWNKQNLQKSILAGSLLLLGANKIMKRSAKVTVKKNQNSANSHIIDMGGDAETKGRYDGLRRSEAMGNTHTKIWRTAGDNRVRDSHAKIDGEEVDLYDKFSNGLKRPKDPDGRPEEIYNCRCTILWNGYGGRSATRSARQGTVTGSYKDPRSFKNTQSIEVANMPYKELMEWLMNQ